MRSRTMKETILVASSEGTVAKPEGDADESGESEASLAAFEVHAPSPKQRSTARNRIRIT